MRIRAILIDTARELLYRRTLLVYFGIVTLTLIVLVLALQTDVANGMITSVRVFGAEGRATPGGFTLDSRRPVSPLDLSPETLVRGVQTFLTWILFPMGILLAVFATASLVPHMLERGSIDLLLSKPVSRPALFGARYLGAFLVAGANLIYFVGGIGIILGIKIGVWNWGFLLSGLVMTAYFGSLLAYLVLVGVVVRSTTVGIMSIAMVYFVSLLDYFPHANADWPMLLTSRLARFGVQGTVEVLYHALPRTYEVGVLITTLILGKPVGSWAPLAWTLACGGAALAAAVLLFRRMDF